MKISHSLAVVATILACVISFFITFKLAEFFGFDLSILKNPDRALAVETVALVIVIHLVPMAIILGSQHFLFRQPIKNLGFTEKPWRATLLGVVSGASIKSVSTIGTIFLSPNIEISFPVLSVNWFAWLPYFLWFLIALNLNSVNEELIYRVFPLSKTSANNNRGCFFLVVASAVLFSVVHFLLEAPDLGSFLYRVAFGVLVGMIYLKFRSLWMIAGFHTGWNFIAMAASNSSWKEGGIITLSGLNSEVEVTLNTIVLVASIVAGQRFLKMSDLPTVDRTIFRPIQRAQ